MDKSFGDLMNELHSTEEARIAAIAERDNERAAKRELQKAWLIALDERDVAQAQAVAAGAEIMRLVADLGDCRDELQDWHISAGMRRDERDALHAQIASLVARCDELQAERDALREKVAYVRTELDAAIVDYQDRLAGAFMDITADELEFGPDAWVYCKDHVKPHQTGWCNIGVSHKISLGTFQGEHAEQARQAYAKARLFGLPIYGES